ncbi:hypothetical protein PV326_001291, partial [Microctonus aethiopoides]
IKSKYFKYLNTLLTTIKGTEIKFQNFWSSLTDYVPLKNEESRSAGVAKESTENARNVGKVYTETEIKRQQKWEFEGEELQEDSDLSRVTSTRHMEEMARKA